MSEWVMQLIEQNGYLAVFLLMLAENIFPPIPSEIIMPLAGYQAGAGQASFIGILLAGTAGSVLGGWFWYYVGCWLGLERVKRFSARHGRWLTMSPEDVEKVDAWFDRRGWIAVMIGRVIPSIRTLISIPAGIAGMPQGRFLLFTTLGTLVWCGALAGIGYSVEDQSNIGVTYVQWFADGVFWCLFAYYVYRFIMFGKMHKAISEP